MPSAINIAESVRFFRFLFIFIFDFTFMPMCLHPFLFILIRLPVYCITVLCQRADFDYSIASSITDVKRAGSFDRQIYRIFSKKHKKSYPSARKFYFEQYTKPRFIAFVPAVRYFDSRISKTGITRIRRCSVGRSHAPIDAPEVSQTRSTRDVPMYRPTGHTDSASLRVCKLLALALGANTPLFPILPSCHRRA